MAKFKFFSSPTNSSPLKQLWRLFQKNHFALVSSWILMFMVFISIFGPLIAPYSPYYQHQVILRGNWIKRSVLSEGISTKA